MTLPSTAGNLSEQVFPYRLDAAPLAICSRIDGLRPQQKFAIGAVRLCLRRTFTTHKTGAVNLPIETFIPIVIDHYPSAEPCPYGNEGMGGKFQLFIVLERRYTPTCPRTGFSFSPPRLLGLCTAYFIAAKELMPCPDPKISELEQLQLEEARELAQDRRNMRAQN